MKTINSKETTREKILEGVNELSNAVTATLGAAGQTVIYEEDIVISNKYHKGAPKVTKDGVTVAKHIRFDDPVKNIGASMVKQAAHYTVSMAGDGTTTSTLLSQNLINAVFQHEGDMREYSKGMQQAKLDIIKELVKVNEDVDVDNIRDVVYISTNSDEELSNLIDQAYREGGKEVMIQPMKNSTRETYLEMEHGITLDSGLMDPSFVNDVENNRFMAEQPLVFLSYSSFEEISQLRDIIEYTIKNKRPLFMVGHFAPRILNALSQNIKAGHIVASVAKPPMSGGMAQQWLQDIADATGGVLHGPHLGEAIQPSPDMLGEADFISQDSRRTVFQMKEKKIADERLTALKNEIDQEKNKGRIETLKKRLANITGAIAVLWVGGDSDAEVDEKYDRAEDAVLAAAAALQKGIVPGGGVALRDAADSVKGLKGSDSYKAGYTDVLKACNAPYRKILENAGVDPSSIEVKKGEAFDVIKDEVVKAKENGIVDPFLVVEQALINSISVAKQLANTSFSVTWSVNEKD